MVSDSLYIGSMRLQESGVIRELKKIPYYVEQWNKELKLRIDNIHYKQWRMVKYQVEKMYIFMCPSENVVYVFSTMKITNFSVQLCRRSLS